MIVILLMLLLVPATIFGYEEVWGSDFPSQEGFGYYGDELNLPTEEWSIDLRGTSLHSNIYPDWFIVEDGILKGRNFECSEQLETINIGALWKSRVIELDINKSYYVEFSLETSNNWDYSSNGIQNDFIRIGYYNDNQQFIQLYEKFGVTNRTKVCEYITNTSECQLVVEVDCNSTNEIFKLREVNLYHEVTLGDSSELIITKLCSPDTYNNNERYVQITNIGNQLIDLTNFSLESIHNNRILYTWELPGLILPRQSLVVGDTDASSFYCDIGKSNWSSRSIIWEGISSNNDGAQIVSNDSRVITDRVVGISFYHGFVERKASNLLASSATNLDGWNYYAISSSADSNPGEYIIDQTLPISLYNTDFSFTESGYLFNWTTFGESNLVGYNLLFGTSTSLSQAIRINPQIILAQQSVQFNNYSFSLAELNSAGYLWLEILSIDEPVSFSEAIQFNYYQPQPPDIIAVLNPLAVTIFPNPSSRNSYLKVSNSKNRVEEIAIYNIKGQLVGKLYPENSSEVYNIQEITESLSSGIYFVSTKFDTNIVTRKLIITK